MALYLKCKNLGYPKSFQLDGRLFFLFFSILPSKINADAINDLEYRKAKMVMKAELFENYGYKVNF